MNQFTYLEAAPSYATIEAAVVARDAAVTVKDKCDKSVLIAKAVVVCITELGLPLGPWSLYKNA